MPVEPVPVPITAGFCEINVLPLTPVPNITLFICTVPLIIPVTVSILPDIKPLKSAVIAELLVLLEIPVTVGAPVEETALYL